MDASEPFFTVVIPTRNRAELLGEAIRAVIGQSWKDFELVVVDDGSTDATQAVVESFDDKRVRLIRQPPSGVSAARNCGAKAARGIFLAFLDSDDVPRPTWLEAFSQSITRQRASMVCCPAVRINAEGRESSPIPVKDLGPELGHQRGQYLAGTFAISRRVFAEIGGYEERMTYSENHELFLRAVPYCQENDLEIANLDQSQLLIRERVASRRYDREKYESIEILLERHGQRLRSNRRMEANLFGVQGVSAARLGHFRDARRAFRAAFKTNPLRLTNLARLTVSLFPGPARALWGTADDEPWREPQRPSV